MILEDSLGFFFLSTFFLIFLPLPKILFVYVIDSAMVLQPSERAEEGGSEPGMLISKPEPDFFPGSEPQPRAHRGTVPGLRVAESAPASPLLCSIAEIRPPRKAFTWG